MLFECIFKSLSDVKRRVEKTCAFLTLSGIQLYMKGKNKPNDAAIAEELERRILHGLAHEWSQALEYAAPAQREAMDPPIFSVRDFKTRLGHWSPRRKEICLNRNLVMNHPWYAVLEVLRHEIAHQFAHQVFGAFGEPPHGPAFQKACRILRANPEATGSYPPLDERILEKNANEKDKILSRVKKLMALARSQNRHEAEAAMAKAHELIAKYNVEIIERDEERRFVSLFLGKPALRHTRDVSFLGGLLMDFYFVKCIWIPCWVIEKCKMGRVLEITGTAQNAKIAAYVFDVVRRYIDSQWNKYNKKGGLTLHRKTDFAEGVIGGFREKLESQRSVKTASQKAGVSARALAKFEDPQLDRYFSYRYPRVRKYSQSAANLDFGVLNDGWKSGRKLVLSRGIEETGEMGKLLPEK